MLRWQRGTDQLAMDIATLSPPLIPSKFAVDARVSSGSAGRARPALIRKRAIGVYNPWGGLSSSLLRNSNVHGILKGTLPSPTLIF